MPAGEPHDCDPNRQSRRNSNHHAYREAAQLRPKSAITMESRNDHACREDTTSWNDGRPRTHYKPECLTGGHHQVHECIHEYLSAHKNHNEAKKIQVRKVMRILRKQQEFCEATKFNFENLCKSLRKNHSVIKNHQNSLRVKGRLW